MATASTPASRRTALAVGAAGGARTFGPWGALAVRGYLNGPKARAGLLTLLAVELAMDKVPGVPARSDPPGLVGRVISGGMAGRQVSGPIGFGIGASAATASTYLSEEGRALLTEYAPLPAAACGLIEDVVVLGMATLATPPHTGDSRAVPPGPAGDPQESDEASDEPVWRTAGRSLVAAAAGTAAMTTVQVSYLRATGGEQSRAPEKTGRRLIRKLTGKRVPRRHRGELNQVMHAAYGTSWGIPFTLLARSRDAERHPARTGIGFGAVAWAVAQVHQPLLGTAQPVWRQAPSAIASDFAFHAVFGLSTAMVNRALSSA